MSTRASVEALVRYVHEGRILDAIDRFYGDDVAMQENGAEPVVGKAANRERERAFFGGVTVHENIARTVVVEGDHAVINWILDFTGGDGKRYRLDQLAFQTWQGGKIVRERFVYDSAAILQAA